MPNNDLILPNDASMFLGGIPVATLQWWRATGRGPRYVKIGRRVFYRQAHLAEFLAAGERQPEREAA